MPIKTMTPTQQQINELRSRFLQKYKQEPPNVPFHAVDMQRVRDDDVWCTRFLEMYDLDMQASIEKLWETCIWRQKYGANDITESNVRQEYLSDGVIFSRNCDIDNKPLLIFRTSLHQKGTKNMDEVMRVVVYWIERLQRERHMTQMTIFFDMSATGLSNMDLDFVKRIIEIFKMYYPNVLNYIIVFEMAWVLNAAFKVIKGLLPAKALEILKVISKKDLGPYVKADNALRHWGGTDDYTFTFVPEQRTATATAASGKQGNGSVATRSNGTLKTTAGNNGSIPAANTDGGTDKKVHFANGSPMREPPPKFQEYEDHYTPQDHDMLRVSPTDSITFTRGESSESTVDISNISNFPVSYKIQTTSPEKFRVRPRCGILSPGESVAVSILLKAEQHLAEGSKDKFLVMSTAVMAGIDFSAQQLTDLWKQKSTNGPDVEQHRICCVYKSAPGEHRNGYGRSETDGNNLHSVKDLASHAKKLEKQLKYTQILQTVTLVFLLILSGAVMYLLKLQIDNASLDAQDFYSTLDATEQQSSCPKKQQL